MLSLESVLLDALGMCNLSIDPCHNNVWNAQRIGHSRLSPSIHNHFKRPQLILWKDQDQETSTHPLEWSRSRDLNSSFGMIKIKRPQFILWNGQMQTPQLNLYKLRYSYVTLLWESLAEIPDFDTPISTYCDEVLLKFQTLLWRSLAEITKKRTKSLQS